MNNIQQRFYKNRAALNVLAGGIENAKEIYAAAEGHVLVGVLSKNYATAEEAAAAVTEYGRAIQDAVSIGLGAGDNLQAAVVAEIAKSYPGSHINQVFPAVGATRANLGAQGSWINSLVSPCGKPGYVNISAGPISSGNEPQAIVPAHAAIALVRDMGGNALKYYPMQGLKLEEEYRAVAKACGEMALLWSLRVESTWATLAPSWRLRCRQAFRRSYHISIPQLLIRRPGIRT